MQARDAGAILVQGSNRRVSCTTTTEVKNWPGDTEVQGPELMYGCRITPSGLGCEIIGDIIISLDTTCAPFVHVGDSGTTYTADA